MISGSILKTMGSCLFVPRQKLSVVDLLDIADIHIVQHVAALGQNSGESSQNIQHE